MDVICTIADSSCLAGLTALRKSLTLSGWTDTLHVYTPDASLSRLPTGCTHHSVQAWWQSGSNTTANAPAMAKPSILLDWCGRCDRVLYLDGSDILFFSHPAKLFDLMPPTAVFAACHGHGKGGTASTSKGLEPSTPLQAVLAASLGPLASDVVRNYNDGVVLCQPSLPRTSLALQWWRTLLAFIPCDAPLRADGKAPKRRIAGVQTAFNLVARHLIDTGVFYELPYSWNTRNLADGFTYTAHKHTLTPHVDALHFAGGRPFPPNLLQRIDEEYTRRLA